MTQPSIDASGKLPVEILSAVFDYLDQPDVLQAAQVSSRWRVVATRHPSYYCYAELAHSTANASSVTWHMAVALFCNKIRHCVRRRISLAIAVFGTFAQSDEDSEGSSTDNHLGVSRDLYLSRVLPAIASSMSLVRVLYISLSSPYASAIYHALRHPAPLLRTFVLQLSMSDGVDAPPPDIFACVAPRLQSVTLMITSLDDDPIPAFSSALDVTLHLHELQLEPVAACFPNARSLTLADTGIWPSSESTDANRPTFMPHLEYLHITMNSLFNPSGICMALQAQFVPHIVVHTHEPPVIRQLLTNTVPELRLAVHRRDAQCAKFALTGVPESSFSRVFENSGEHRSTSVLYSFRPFHERLTHIGLDLDYLAALTFCFKQLPVLTALSVRIPASYHILDGPFYHPYSAGWIDGDFSLFYVGCRENDFDNVYRVNCPRLVTLTLSADTKYRATVPYPEIVDLARDLSLPHQPGAILRVNNIQLLPGAWKTQTIESEPEVFVAVHIMNERPVDSWY